MPNPLSPSRPAEPEPSGKGTAKRNLSLRAREPQSTGASRRRCKSGHRPSGKDPQRDRSLTAKEPHSAGPAPSGKGLAARNRSLRAKEPHPRNPMPSGRRNRIAEPAPSGKGTATEPTGAARPRPEPAPARQAPLRRSGRPGTVGAGGDTSPHLRLGPAGLEAGASFPKVPIDAHTRAASIAPIARPSGLEPRQQPYPPHREDGGSVPESRRAVSTRAGEAVMRLDQDRPARSAAQRRLRRPVAAPIHPNERGCGRRGRCAAPVLLRAMAGRGTKYVRKRLRSGASSVRWFRNE